MRILTFDIEDWFHFLELPSTSTENQWVKFDSRVENNTRRILEILSANDQKATFFVIGWIAEKYPQLVKTIQSEGHQLGLHSYGHQLIWQQDHADFRADILRNIAILQEITGEKISLYRAPGFSIKRFNTEAFDIMAEAGITTDSSIFPTRRAHGGMPNFPYDMPCIIEQGGIRIKEFPISYSTLAGIRYVFSGGGYFRLWPYPLIRHATNNSPYVMSYFHPRDLDRQQPILKELSPYRRFKSYYGIGQCEKKLLRWINEFHFVDVVAADAQVDWSKAPVVHFKKTSEH